MGFIPYWFFSQHSIKKVQCLGPVDSNQGTHKGGRTLNLSKHFFLPEDRFKVGIQIGVVSFLVMLNAQDPLNQCVFHARRVINTQITA